MYGMVDSTEDHCSSNIFLLKIKFSPLKNKTENKSTWEGASYQNEWVKLTQVELFSILFFKGENLIFNRKMPELQWSSVLTTIPYISPSYIFIFFSLFIKNKFISKSIFVQQGTKESK